MSKLTAERMIRPPAQIGIMGGGQLGQMLVLAARAMGYRTAVLDPSEPCSAGMAADVHIRAPYHSLPAAEALASGSDVLTYEFENIPAPVVAALEEHSYFPQGASLLEISQDRLLEKRALTSAGLPTAPYEVVDTPEQLTKAVAKLGTPCLLKTRHGGYDGKGQYFLRCPDDAEALRERLLQERDVSAFPGPWLLETYLTFAYEISVIVVRSSRGEVQCFPTVVNEHRRGILHSTSAGAQIPERVDKAAQNGAKALAESLELVGTLAVEMFVLPDGSLAANEMAPRPHNSGHWTQDGASICQFQQHIRAITGQALVKPQITRPTVMLNILGEHQDKLLEQWEQLPAEAFVHLYSKGEPRPGRKMGHINCCGSDFASAKAVARHVSHLLQFDSTEQ